MHLKITAPLSPAISRDSSRCASPAQISWMRIGFVVLCIIFAITPLVNTQRAFGQNKDYDIWYEYGQKVVHGEALYPEAADEQFGYMYPPTLAIFFFAPMSMLGYTAFVALFVLSNCLVWFAAYNLCLYLVAGSTTRVHPLLALLPFVATVPFVYDTFLLGQVNILLLLLMAGMFWFLRLDRPWLAGGSLALASAMKAFPLSALAYLIYRRHWQAALATVLWLVAILAIFPAPFRGFERNAHELALWYRGMLADQSGNSIGQRSETGFTYKNQSLVAVVHRLTRPLPAGDYEEVVFYVNVMKLTPRESQFAAYGAIMALGLIYLACMPNRRRQTLLSLRCEEAMLLLMVIFCSPLAWTYFFCWTIPAWITIVYFLTDSSIDCALRRRGWWFLGISSAVMLSAISQSFDQTAQALGVTLWGSIGLFLILGWIMRKSSRDFPLTQTADSA